MKLQVGFARQTTVKGQFYYDILMFLYRSLFCLNIEK